MKLLTTNFSEGTETKQFEIAFMHNRNCDFEVATVEISALVPVNKRKFAMALVMEVNGYKDISNIMYMKNPSAWTATECGGLPSGVDCAAAGY